jgi:Tol biopolymer transport system component
MTSLGRGRSPQWSPSGRRIVFGNFGRAAGQLWFERPDGSRRHGKALGVCDTSNGAGWPTDWFGSGGGGILFVWGCDPDIPGGSIWKVHSDASDPQLILANVDYDSYQDARMSPDGATVAWGRNVFGSDGGSADIGRIGALGNGYYTQWQDTTCEPFDRPCDAGYPSWSPTGNRLAYGFVNGDRISWIATMDPTDQGSPTMVIEGIRPVWS